MSTQGLIPDWPLDCTFARFQRIFVRASQRKETEQWRSLLPSHPVKAKICERLCERTHSDCTAKEHSILVSAPTNRLQGHQTRGYDESGFREAQEHRCSPQMDHEMDKHEQDLRLETPHNTDVAQKNPMIKGTMNKSVGQKVLTFWAKPI